MSIRRLTSLLALPAFLMSIPSAKADWNSTIAAANPLHWYSFEPTTPGGLEISSVEDLGSAGLDGTFIGTAGSGVLIPGLVGSAASFDGIRDHVLLGAPNLVGDWTVESILRADPVNGGASQGIIGADFTAADRVALKADQWNHSGQLGFTLFGVVDVTFVDPAAATPSDYAYVTFVGTSAGVELFVNGQSLGSDPLTTSLSRFVLGAGAVLADSSLIDPLNGAIDEMVIYDRALSSEEISTHFAAVPEPSTVGLILLGALSLYLFQRHVADGAPHRYGCRAFERNAARK